MPASGLWLKVAAKSSSYWAFFMTQLYSLPCDWKRIGITVHFLASFLVRKYGCNDKAIGDTLY